MPLNISGVSAADGLWVCLVVSLPHSAEPLGKESDYRVAPLLHRESVAEPN